MEIMRTEHPKPQFQRDNWRNLNGEWQFEVDNGKSAEERKLYLDTVKLSEKINVPFCPESSLSGIGRTDFLYGVVYKREFDLSSDDMNGIVKFHFGAVDYQATVYVNEKKVGTHKGGYISFAFDITNAVKEGTNVVTVIVEDDTRNGLIPSGKQSNKYDSYGCFYTRTTGIWQTVWLEFVPKTHIESVKYYPNVRDTSVEVKAELCGAGHLEIDVLFDDKKVGGYCADLKGGKVSCNIKLEEAHLWEVGKGNLYTVVLRYGDDLVNSYFGLREVRLDGYKFLINEKSVFQRLILDQGFYPDGIYTAPSDEALLNDIKMSMAMGFNGARLHEKIFEERFLYHCDKMGYIVWGEFPSWGVDMSDPQRIYPEMNEWLEELQRDFNHPAIIGWCPLNEEWSVKLSEETIAMIYDLTKAIDTTRPCIDTSGGVHVKTEIYDVHDYEQNPEIFKEHYDKLMTDGELYDWIIPQTRYQGQATFVSEYGGIRWSSASESEAWGYGDAPKTEEEFIARFKGLTEALLGNDKMFGLCYTQLTDVEQEQNGLYTYSRAAKFKPEIISAIMKQKAAIED